VDATRAVSLFSAAGLAEIGGGYLVWGWLREGAPVIVGVIGALILVTYGVIPTLQTRQLRPTVTLPVSGVLAGSYTGTVTTSMA
jgi:drug/metabolite transporter superfamily protein YnfA